MVTPATITAPAEGTSERIVVDASRGGCAWTAEGGTSWLTLESAGGVGDGAVVARIQSNTANAPRTAILTVAGQAVSVSQAAAPVAGGTEVRLNGAPSDVSGTCPSIELRVENRLVRTNASTDFAGNQCERVRNARNVDVRGMTQPDGSVLALRIRVMGTPNEQDGGLDAER